MTYPVFGRVVPIHLDMLALIGYELSLRDVTLDIPPGRRIENMIDGWKGLKEQTSQDFGFDLSAWRNFLMGNEEAYGYTHPYAFSGVDKAVRAAIRDKKRNEVRGTWEGTTRKPFGEFRRPF